MKRRYFPPKAPTMDSPRARSDAVQYLTNVRDISTVTTEKLCRCYRLKPATAEKMLTQELMRRAAHDSAR
jgi:hypothetical protein